MDADDGGNAVTDAEETGTGATEDGENEIDDGDTNDGPNDDPDDDSDAFYGMIEVPFAMDIELIRCEYSEFGGMENVHHSFTLEADEPMQSLIVTEEDGDGVATYEASPDALIRLSRLMAARRPETWAALPDSELIALDAPSERLTLTCADGTEYVLDDYREGAGEILWLARCFMESYTVDGARTFELSLTSSEGSGSAFHVELSAPETVWISGTRANDAPNEGTAPGYRETLVFHGRVPGRTELIIEDSGLTAPADGAEGQKVYLLEVDEGYNVACVGVTEK